MQTANSNSHKLAASMVMAQPSGLDSSSPAGKVGTARQWASPSSRSSQASDDEISAAPTNAGSSPDVSPQHSRTPSKAASTLCESFDEIQLDDSETSQAPSALPFPQSTSASLARFSFECSDSSFAMPVLDGVTGLPQEALGEDKVQELLALFHRSNDLAFHMQIMFLLRQHATSSQQMKKRIGRANGIDAILHSMALHKGPAKSNAMLQELAVWTLWSLAEDEENRNRIRADRKALTVVLDAMLEHADVSGVQEQGAWFLSWFVWQDVHSCQRARLCGAQDIVYASIVNHAQHPGVQQFAHNCLEYLDSGLTDLDGMLPAIDTAAAAASGGNRAHTEQTLRLVCGKKPRKSWLKKLSPFNRSVM